MKKITTVLAAVFVFAIGIALSANTTSKEGKVNAINSEYSFVYSFPEKPKLGTYVLKVNLFKKNEKVKDLTVMVFYNMPTCGYHRSGKLSAMQLNKNNDYLMPLNFAMRGAWEVTLIFQQNGKNLHSEKFSVKI
ncbi:MAG: FixH family protein [Leptospirales bacterium]|nr:FixH family protein [Leptospirales bacterium]